jgi:hypothetical protein
VHNINVHAFCEKFVLEKPRKRYKARGVMQIQV